VVERIDRQRIGDPQADPAVHAAEHGEVAVERCDVRVEGVVDADRDDVVGAGLQGVGDVEPEPGEPALVPADVPAVDPDLGDQARAVELQVQATPGVPGRRRVVAAVPAFSARVVVAAVLAVFAVPGVRHVDLAPRPVVEAGLVGARHGAVVEPPAGVEVDPLACGTGGKPDAGGRLPEDGRCRGGEPGGEQHQACREDQGTVQAEPIRHQPSFCEKCR
jgi:hypothetical protein